MTVEHRGVHLDRPGAGIGGVALHQAAQFLDVVAVEGLRPDHHFEPVEFGRVVGPGDLESAVHVDGLDREVETRRRQQPDIHRRAAGRRNPVSHGAGKRSAGGAIVSSYREPGRSADAPSRVGREGAA